ncbi:MAG: hypothetical protein Q7W45_03290 [Bacteroidota bacterium]|nr:hypothetical protein [Bacteroidota bacterium]MDP3145721.1 hypothetical protein [Bacteroidota bacterium]
MTIKKGNNKIKPIKENKKSIMRFGFECIIISKAIPVVSETISSNILI